MSKTNAFTLIATLLLVILLYTILRFAANLPDTPPAESIRETTTTAPTVDNKTPTQQSGKSGLPVVSNHAELIDFLNSLGIDGRRATVEAARWFQERGFLGINTLLGISEENSRDFALQSLDDATLQSMLDKGDAGASQILGSRLLFTDPFAALDLFHTAAEQGSTYAIWQIASLLETLNDRSLDDFVTDPAYLRKLVELRNQDSASSPTIAPLSFALAAARDGGLPVIDTQMLSWLRNLTGGIFESELQTACERSAQLFVEFSAKRRQRGLPPVLTDPPAVFLSIPELATQLPCRATSYPIIQLLSLGQCSSTLVEDSRGNPMNLYICENQ